MHTTLAFTCADVHLHGCRLKAPVIYIETLCVYIIYLVNPFTDMKNRSAYAQWLWLFLSVYISLGANYTTVGSKEGKKAHPACCSVLLLQ